MTAPPPCPAMTAHGLGRTFRAGLFFQRKIHALRGVTFAIPRGATAGLVGPNGSGKSTLLRILSGVDRPTAGAAASHGDDPTSLAAKRRLGFLPDGQPFPKDLSASQTLNLVASLRGMDRTARRQAVPEMLERVGLGARGRAKLASFSRGMHRRFGLGQAFLGTPEVILLDEPTAGLDAPGFHVFDDLIRGAKARGATVLLASHVASDLVEHCDELILLRDGQLVRSGTPDELLGDEGTVEVLLRSSHPDGVEGSVSEVAEKMGAEVVAVRRRRRSLLELYGDDGG